MANITEHLKKVLTAVYGREVRQNYHDALKAINEETESTTARQQTVENRQTTLENKYDTQIKNITDSNPSNVEIVDMRTDKKGNTFDTAGKRLDNFDSQLEQIALNVYTIGVSESNTAEQNSSILNTYIKNNKINKIKFYFPNGTYLFSKGICWYNAHCFEGESTSGTILKFDDTSTEPAFYLPEDAKDDNYAFGYIHQFFKNFTVKSNGDIYGGNAKRDGLIFGFKEHTSLINIPCCKFYNIYVLGFKTNFYIEGYGHYFQNFHSYNCENGLQIVHPEQVAVINPWIQYCNVGLTLNPLDKVTRCYGHNFTLIGGSVQRNKIQGRLYNTSDINITTYCEQGVNHDFIIGDENDASNYDNGCKNVNLNINTERSIMTGESLILANCVKGNINYCNYTTNSETDDIKVMGYSKYIKINVCSELVGKITIEGEAQKNTKIICDEYLKIPALNNKIVEFNNGNSNIFDASTKWVNNKNALDINLNNSFLAIETNKDDAGLVVIDSRTGETIFCVTPKYFTFKGTDLVCQSPGRGIGLTSPDGKKELYITINNEGEVVKRIIDIN